VLVLDMIEILPPLRKYKYDTWIKIPVKCYIDNSVCLRSYIRNVSKHFWHHCWGGSQYLLSIYRLQWIILASIISLTDLSTTLCVFMAFTRRCINVFSALSSANIRTGPEMNIRDGSLNLNQLSSTWCSKARSAARPRRMLMLIFNTSWRSVAHSLCEE
jgi:hypothetical protein